MDNHMSPDSNSGLQLCGEIPCEDCDFFICCTNFDGLCDKCLMDNMECLPIIKIRSGTKPQ